MIFKAEKINIPINGNSRLLNRKILLKFDNGLNAHNGRNRGITFLEIKILN